MIKIFFDKETMELEQQVRKLLKFCFSISNKLTLSTSLSCYRLLTGELTKALDDIWNEYVKEDENRRSKYLSDNEFKESLLNTYGTHEVMEYFDRLSKYDLNELENVKETLLLYNKELEDSTLPIKFNASVDILLPQDSYLGEKFSACSLCSIGGLYKVYSFKIDTEIERVLLEICDLYCFYSFNNVYTLDDPTFYYDDKLVCSIYSHGYTNILCLNDEQYKSFTELGIPHRVERIV